MKKEVIIFGFVFLVLASLVRANFISTSNTTDKSVMLASSGDNENGSFTSLVMTGEEASLSRSMFVVRGLCLMCR